VQFVGVDATPRAASVRERTEARLPSFSGIRKRSHAAAREREQTSAGEIRTALTLGEIFGEVSADQIMASAGLSYGFIDRTAESDRSRDHDGKVKRFHQSHGFAPRYVASAIKVSAW
jgi:hypothetical protein